MYQIFLILSLISFLILSYFLIKKAPQLVEYKEKYSIQKPNLFLKIREKISEMSFMKEMSWNILLQKSLSKIRVELLKIENKIGEQLHFLRKNSILKKKSKEK